LNIETVNNAIPGTANSALDIPGAWPTFDSILLTTINNTNVGGVAVLAGGEGITIGKIALFGAQYADRTIQFAPGSSGSIRDVFTRQQGLNFYNYTSSDILKNWTINDGGDSNYVKQVFNRYIVSTTSTTIVDLAEFGSTGGVYPSGLYYITGTKYDPQDTTTGFTDLLLVSGLSSTPTFTVVTSINSSASARTYSVSNESLLCSMGSNTYLLHITGSSTAGPY